MKKQFTLIGFSILFIAALALTPSTQQEKKNKGNNDQEKGKPGKGNQGNQGNQGNRDKNEKAEAREDKMEQKQNDRDDKGNNRDKDKDRDDDNRSKMGKNDDDKKDKKDWEDGYKWNRENFKDRKKLKDQEKVTICHNIRKGNENTVTIRVSANAVKAHMNHGDVMGNCPVVNDNRYSDVFIRNRTDYYNTLQNGQEQVVYSKSILDYAMERLTGSRLQLANMQKANLPAAEIEVKQARVVELEQNVSVLEQLLGVAANLIASKLQ